MVELTPQERLQPALLDRLTDNEPENKQEPRERRVVSKEKLRQGVLRDLAWLFNSTRIEGAVDFTGAEYAKRSVINFGLPAMSGRSAQAISVIDLERSIHEAIRDFEPRILAETLRVKALLTNDYLDHHNVIGVEIHAQLWAQPMPLELLVRTEIDLETGKVEISDVASARIG